jgi:hypothetical protein
MTALVIGKVALVAFLIVGFGVLVIAYVRRRRAGVQPWKNPQAAPYLDIYCGGLPPIPPPPQPAEDRFANGGPPARGVEGPSSPKAD